MERPATDLFDFEDRGDIPGTDSAGGNPIAGASAPGKVGEDAIDDGYVRARLEGQRQNRLRIERLAHSRIHAAVGRDGVQMSAESFDGRGADGAEATQRECPARMRRCNFGDLNSRLAFSAACAAPHCDKRNRVDPSALKDADGRNPSAYEAEEPAIYVPMRWAVIDADDAVTNLHIPAHAALFRMVMDLARSAMAYCFHQSKTSLRRSALRSGHMDTLEATSFTKASSQPYPSAKSFIAVLRGVRP